MVQKINFKPYNNFRVYNKCVSNNLKPVNLPQKTIVHAESKPASSSVYLPLSLISFGKKQLQINMESRAFSKNDYFPDYKKVPDGFKYNETKRLYADEGITKKGSLGKHFYPDKEQITIVDRQRDSNLKTIKADYKKVADTYLVELKQDKALSKKQKNELLIENTVNYVRGLKQSPLVDELYEPSIPIAGRESYLGDVFACKKNVCRHNAFLTKLLLEDYNIPLAVQSGYIISPYGSGHHCWNTNKDSSNKEKPYDASFQNGECWYFKFDGSPLYLDNLPLQKQTEYDVLTMQVGDELMLGFDEEDNVISSKTNENASFFAKLYLDEFDTLMIERPDEDIYGFDYDYTLDQKNNVIFYNTETNEKIFQFPYDNLVYFLKLKIAADSIKLSKMLNIPMPNGKINYQELMKHKELYKQIDPAISQKTVDSILTIMNEEAE